MAKNRLSLEQMKMKEKLTFATVTNDILIVICKNKKKNKKTKTKKCEKNP